MREAAARLLGRLPPALRGAFERGERDAFDRAVRASELFDPGVARGVKDLGDDLDTSPGGSPYDLLDRAARRALVDECSPGD